MENFGKGIDTINFGETILKFNSSVRQEFNLIFVPAIQALVRRVLLVNKSIRKTFKLSLSLPLYTSKTNGYGHVIQGSGLVFKSILSFFNQVKMALNNVCQATVFQTNILRISGRKYGTDNGKDKKLNVLDQFFDISPDLLCICSLDGIIKKISSNFEQKLGYSRDELLGKSFYGFIHAEDTFNVREHWKDISKPNANAQFEVKLISKNGEAKLFLWSLAISKGEGLVFSVGKDISAQKEAETNLFFAYERLGKVQDMVKLGYWSKFQENPIVDWTIQTYEIFGQEKENFIPSLKNIVNCCHQEDRHHLRKVFNGDLASRNEYSFEHRVITSTGQVRWLHQSINIKRNGQEEISQIEGVVQDVTAHKLIEQKLRVSNERFSLAMKATNEMIWDWDFETNFIVRSKGFEKFFNYLFQESSAKTNSWFSKVYPEDIDELWDSLEKAISDPFVDHWQMEYRIFNRDFEVCYVVDRCFILRNDKREIVRAVGAVQDVTAFRKYMEAISAQNKKLRRISWMHSHILRAPLTRVMSMVLVLKEQESIDEDNAILYNKMLEACHEMDAVIRKIARESEIIKIEN